MFADILNRSFREFPSHAVLLSLALLPFAAACQETEVSQPDAANTPTSTEAAKPEEIVVAVDDSDGADTPYAIECSEDEATGEKQCLVDSDTFIGWRTFHGFCHVCHAQDAVGSTFAPSLLDRMQEIDFEMFVERTANGYTGQVGVMPPWKDNPNVSKRYKELYAYLRARADGVLPRGRPKKKPKPK